MKKIVGLMLAITMLIGILPMALYAEGDGTGLDVSVDFVADYLENGNNEYYVFGKNNSIQAKSVQTVRTLYNGGTLVAMDYGTPFSVASGQEFSVLESVNIPNGTDISNSYINVYLWDSMDNFMPLTKEFGKNSLSFTFNLAQGSTTSAGVYDENGVLVRTLWSAVYYNAGNYTKVWDGFNDEGNMAKAGSYTVKILTHNIEYRQDALLANSTARDKVETIMTSYQPISDMTLLGDEMYYADQYMENYYTLMRFNINDIHRKSGYFEKRGNRVPIRVTNDGETVYWMMFETTPTGQYNAAGSYDTSVYGQRRCFIMGVDAAENKQVIFEHGQSLWDYWGANSATTYQSAIGYEPYFESEGVGHYSSSGEVGYCDITVQQNGNFLVATYGNRDFVRVINKTTGETLKDNPLSKPTAVVFDTSDRLWVAYTDANGNYAISAFDIAADGTITQIKSVPSQNIHSEVLGLAFSPDGTYMTAVFGKGNYKLYAYNLSDWSCKWIYGRGEDYAEDTTVYDDKFMFHDGSGSRDYTYLTFQGNDYLWIGDPGNDRNFKLYVGGSGTPTIADTLWFSKQHYACEVDANNPTRVFFGPKEYKIDYSKEGDKSWTLYKNYIDTVAPYIAEETSGMFRGITTLDNGKTYFVGTLSVDLGQDGSTYRFSKGDKYIFELTEHGFANTGVLANGWGILENGKLTLQKAEAYNYNGVSGTAIYQIDIKGYNASGNPMWGDKEIVAFMPDSETGWNALGSDVAISDNGIVFPVSERADRLSFRTGENIRDFRIGGFKAELNENNTWLFKTGPATPVNYDRYVFPRDGHIEISPNYGLSGEAKAYGDNMIIHYRGEGYKGSQANIFYHYLDNGLLVGVFGETALHQTTYEDYGQSLVNGNGFGWRMAFPNGKDSDSAYIYQGGESRMSGVVRTKVTGLKSINILEIPVTLGCVYRNGVRVTAYSTADCANTSKISDKIRYDFTFPDDAANVKSVKYETYVKADENENINIPLWAYTDGNVKIVYNNNDLTEGSGIVAKTITASSEKYKKLTVYVTPKDGVLSYFRLKTNIDGDVTDIPTKYLNAEAEKIDTGVTERDLLEGLPFDSTVTGSLAGWNFENWTGTYTNAKTNVGSYDYLSGSSLYLYGYLLYGETPWATRDLGEKTDNLEAWEIDTEFTMSGVPNGNYYYEYNDGSIKGPQGKYMDILDATGKIIARITFEQDFSLRLNNQVILQTQKSYADQSDLSYVYTHDLTVPSELKIFVKNGKVTATYRGNSVTTNVYDNGADWKNPKTFKVSAFKNCRRGPHPTTMAIDLLTLDYIQYAKGFAPSK